MISHNPLLSKASGRLGNIIVKQYGDKTVISAFPDMSRRKLTPKQKEQNQRMKMANRAAKALTRNSVEKQRACELLKVPANKVFRALVKEFLLTDGESPVFRKTEQEKQDDKTLKELKTAILKEVPEAQVMIFGEKVKNPGKPLAHWDLLVLTKDDHPPLKKWELHERLRAITMPLGTQVNLLMVQSDKWEHEQAYEEVRKRIESELVVLT
jgi:predicted nucleotidyltransferase